MLRRAARRDSTEAEIVGVLLAYGFSVHRMSAPALPDLLVGRAGVTHLIECKNRAGRATPAQKQFSEAWRGSSVVTLRNGDDTVAWVESLP